MPEERLPKVVLDTNVFISGIILPLSLPGKILDLWRKNKFILVTSKSILKELNKVFHYPKIIRTYKIKEEIIRELLINIAKTSIVVFKEKEVEVIPEDKADNKFLSCAVSARVDFIVSGDTHLLKLKNFQGITILKPKEFLEILNG